MTEITKFTRTLINNKTIHITSLCHIVYYIFTEIAEKKQKALAHRLGLKMMIIAILLDSVYMNVIRILGVYAV